MIKDKWLPYQVPNDRLGRYVILLDQGLPGAKSQIACQVRGAANAELMAAGPDLLRALARLTNWAKSTHGPFQVEFTGDHPIAEAERLIGSLEWSV